MAVYVTVICDGCGAPFTSDDGGAACACPVCGREYPERASTVFALPTEVGRLTYRADAALYAKRFDEAEALYKQAVKADKKCAVPYLGLALSKNETAFDKSGDGFALRSLNGKGELARRGEYKKAIKLAGAELGKAISALAGAVRAVRKKGGIVYDPDEFEISDGRLETYKGKAADVVIPDGVTRIENNAFFMSETVKSVHIPASVKTVECGALTARVPIERIDVDPENTYYVSKDGHLVDKVNGVLVRGVSGAPVPDGIREIADKAFQMSDVKRAVLPRGVKKIGEQAYAACDLLEYVEIPHTLTKIDECAFEYSGAIKKFEIDEDNPIYAEADGCLFDKSDDSVLRGGADGKIPERTVYIEDAAYSGCDATSIFIPKNVESIGDRAFDLCEELVKIEVDKDNAKFAGKGNCIITRHTGELVRGCAGSVIPEGEVKEILDDAFKSVSKLTKIAIPRGVERIGGGAFSDCSDLEKVILPNTLESIGDFAFENCYALTTVLISASVVEIGTSPGYCEVFYDCTSFENAVFLDPAGWYACADGRRDKIPTEALRNPKKAAEILKEGLQLVKKV